MQTFMKLFRPVVYILLLLLMPVAAGANYMFKHIGVQQGLSQSTVYAILQDRTGFIWFGTKAGLNRFDGTTIKVYHRQNDAHSLGSEVINVLFEDKHGHIWVGTDEGVYIYTPETDAFARFSVRTANRAMVKNNVTLICGRGNKVYIAANEQGLFCYDLDTKQLHNYRFAGHPNISGMGFDAKGNMWIGFFGGGLYYSSNDRGRMLHAFKDASGKEYFRGDIVSSTVPVGSHTLMVGSDRHGLCAIDMRNRSVKSIVSRENGKNVFVRNLIRNGNEIWAATEMGLYVYDIVHGNIQHFGYEPSNPYSLSDNPLYGLCRDREGGMWAGSYFGGVNHMPKQYPVFDKFIPQIGNAHAIHGRHVREMRQDGNGNIWIGSEDGGLNCFNPHTGIFSFVTESAAFPNIHGLCVDGKNLWVGTFSYGLKLIDIDNCRVIKSFAADGKAGSLRDNTVFAICLSRRNDLWLGTIRGLCRYNRARGTFEYAKGVPFILINDVYEDVRGNLWVGTQTDGVYCLQAANGKWKHYTHATSKSGLSSDKIISIFEDSGGQLWVTTQGAGVCRYDSRRDAFEVVPIPQYTPAQTVFQIVEDNEGLFWLSTYNGIISYNPDNKESKIYASANGLLDNQFNYKSSLVDAEGRIYFGSLNGLIRFSPHLLKGQVRIPKIVATELRIGNSVIDNFSSDTPLKTSITFTKELTLAHDQNSFSVRVVALSFATPQLNQMEYKLDGYDREWQRMRTDNYIAYTNLPAGDYRLLVRVKGDNGVWSRKIYQLSITVKQPFWLSAWAKLFYTIFILLIVWWVYRNIELRSKRRHTRALELLEHEKEQEMYQSKIHFFTNVAHEIRTPLTLIKGPLENILQGKKVENKEVQDDLNIMYKNTNRLNDLINQLLDFRKTESSGLRMNFEYCNIGKIVTEVYDRFRPLMREKGINATLSLPAEAVHAYVDHEAFTKIVSNLMNNAVKYCASRVSVILSKHEEEFVLTVMNDGSIIPSTMREKIFMPFFRMDTAVKSSTTGTGIGLAIARSLTELHGGHIEMDNSKDINIFRLTLPVNQEDTIRLADNDSIDHSQTVSANTPESSFTHDYTLLVVEDNVQMQEYQKAKLQTEYNVLTASDGEEALQVLARHTVNAIVTDVMMEPMNGFELCRSVKHNVEYSHIPVILLTAVTMEAAKIEGMESGADAYIVKPFRMDYLLSTIKNLLITRENIKKAYSDSPFVSSNSVSISKADAEFLARLERVMNSNISNSEFNVDRMAADMNMSRTSLNRKIRGTLDVSPNDYIKIERLKRAAQLLKEGKTKINEVCYRVGFSTPSYFTKCFYKQFGMLPKEFLVQQKDEQKEA